MCFYLICLYTSVAGYLIHYSSFPGYFVAIVAGLWPALAKSVVLLNGAGSVAPGYSSVPLSEVR